MRTTNWTIEFCCVKAHVGIQGNEFADTYKGGSVECGPYRELQESPKECGDEWAQWDKCRGVATGMGPNIKKGAITKE